MNSAANPAVIGSPEAVTADEPHREEPVVGDLAPVGVVLVSTAAVTADAVGCAEEPHVTTPVQPQKLPEPASPRRSVRLLNMLYGPRVSSVERASKRKASMSVPASSGTSSSHSGATSKCVKKTKEVSLLNQLPLKRTPKPLGKNKLKALSDCYDLITNDILLEAEAHSVASTSCVRTLDLNEWGCGATVALGHRSTVLQELLHACVPSWPVGSRSVFLVMFRSSSCLVLCHPWLLGCVGSFLCLVALSVLVLVGCLMFVSSSFWFSAWHVCFFFCVPPLHVLFTPVVAFVPP